ncbi:MAG: hypothetical protein GZ093_01005 [Rhodoferax sp.]|uniref:hypothetical protein n=1 Tax=Rhodoferax sp. TaxID=50421 RepID=UPI0013FF7553|nr:hypothetical protein [Rhodoferax sp.]NDP37323.1 hypothetical protein [Rhodoferax sp.]
MSTPIKDVLQTLSRHADLVAQALSGVVTVGDDASHMDILALRQVGALRPVDEDGYRLHPRLREYLQDHLQLFPAFQSLADIGAKITLLKSLWDEVEILRGDRESVVGMVDELQTTVLDIGDTMNRNMLQLQILMSTRYGNVRSLEAKKSQNRFYQKQTSVLSGDVQRLAREVERIEREASIRGRDDLARFIRRQLLTRMMFWQHGLSDMQTFLRNEIYRLRVLEQDLKLLARTDMLLRQQPGWRGFEADLSGEIPAFLLATRLPALVAHIEPMESDRGMADEMAALARDLPTKAALPIPVEPPKRYTRIVDPPVTKPITPAMKALGKLLRDVKTADGGLSLIEWRKDDVDAQTMPPTIWLVLALAALRAGQYEVALVRNMPREGERFAHTFRDAKAFPKKKGRPTTASSQGVAV